MAKYHDEDWNDKRELWDPNDPRAKPDARTLRKLIDVRASSEYRDGVAAVHRIERRLWSKLSTVTRDAVTTRADELESLDEALEDTRQHMMRTLRLVGEV